MTFYTVFEVVEKMVRLPIIGNNQRLRTIGVYNKSYVYADLELCVC